ncbi:MAG: carbohydrate-binding protein [Lachnospiraceae bacterium]
MADLTLCVKNKNGEVLVENTHADRVNLVYQAAFQEGDSIVFSTMAVNRFYVIQVDDAIAPALIYLTNPTWTFDIPFGEQKVSYSPKSFLGEMQYMTVRAATDEEVGRYRNLALNSHDQHGDRGCYPHASANVETRGEAVFAARNAIDGILENHSHGFWPFQSWGINQDPNAEIMIEFGRTVEIDKMALWFRCDWVNNHDNWWVNVTFEFSDGTVLSVPTTKTDEPQYIELEEKKKVEWIKLGKLIKSDDPAPFPALSQWEVFGTECK